MNFNFHRYKFASQRNTVFSRRGAVATSQPLAAEAGLTMMKRGGNAFDAILATAAVLTVVEPTSNGLGGDCFALFKAQDGIKGLNASGYLPAEFSLNLEERTNKNDRRLNPYSWEAVTVPGQLAGWQHLKENYARLDWEEILKPAWYYAKEGFPVSPVVAGNWQLAIEKYKKELPEIFLEEYLATFSIEGRAPKAGEMWKSAEQAQTLESFRKKGVMDFYKGDIASRIAEFAQKTGGMINQSDLANYSPKNVQPLKIDYRGHEILELPPNGQGLIALQALKILAEDDFKDFFKTEEMHRRIEALKLAFADGSEYIGDWQFNQYNPEVLLTDDYIEKRRQLIGDKAKVFAPGEIDQGGTVYLAAADEEGNIISFIQSNYTGFGSGLVVPGTGISLHNRGYNFVLEEGHHNYPKAGKRPYHTIIPGFYRKPGQYLGAFGVMGGFMQPQGHLQVIQNMVDYGLNPQEALDAPRWRWQEKKKIVLENTFPDFLAQELERRGHEVVISHQPGGFGRGQMILLDQEKGHLITAVEPRADSQAAVY